MGRLLFIVFFFLLALPGSVQAQEQEAKLRTWYVGMKSATTWYDTHDVFGKDVFPENGIEEYGNGMELFLGGRLGGRFLLGAQLVGSLFGVSDGDEDITRIEVQFSGTVIFRERDTFQPFLRGGIGGGLTMISLGTDKGELISLGSSALFSGGLQVRVSSRLSIECEAASTFSNFLEVTDNSTEDLWAEENWRVRDSSWGWRIGVGAAFWF